MALSRWLALIVVHIGICYVLAEEDPTVTTTTIPPPPADCNRVSQFYCYKTDEQNRDAACMQSYVRCDGVPDCQGGEDEENCESCEVRNQFNCSTQTTPKCIQKDWLCDGEDDCDDGLDEKDCGDVVCGDDQRKCSSENRCIASSWFCDGQTDCAESEDEKDCGTEKCPDGEVICANDNDMCISTHWVCDGSDDCPGGTDELHCGPLTCSSDNFLCKNESNCIPDRWTCDGEHDCEDGSDEGPTACSASVAPAHDAPECTENMEFQCLTGRKECILHIWKCDGGNDCEDGSDEDGCENIKHECRPGEFKCDDDTCIPGQLRCSGQVECPDKSDEADCLISSGTSKYCTSDSFACNKEQNKNCIALSRVCDGTRDCGEDGDVDELPDMCQEYNNPTTTPARADPCSLNPCKGPNVSCKTRTYETIPWGYDCKCDAGYHSVNATSCADINECNSSSPPCDQICSNTEGSFTCHCYEGFLIAANRRTCKASGIDHPRLLFTNRYDIRAMSMYNRKSDYMPLLDSKSAVALDFDFKNKAVFYADSHEKKIFKFTLPDFDGEGDEISKIDLQIQNINRPESLAYDWVHGNLYWVDTVGNTINMAPTLGDSRGASSVIYEAVIPCTDSVTHPCLDEPRGVAVHPQKGWLFWSDWGQNASIVMSGMDGSNPRKIAHNTESKTHLVWPNGITLDISNPLDERIYWIDAKLASIYSCQIENCMNSIQLVLYSTNTIKHPYAITIFEDLIYWSDWKVQEIYSANKHDGKNISKVLERLDQPMDLKVFHTVTQPIYKNQCANLSVADQCQHICVPKAWSNIMQSPRASPPQKKTVCLCQVGYELHADMRSCRKLVSATIDPPVARTSAQSKSQGMATGTIAAIGAGSAAFIMILGALIAVMIVKKVKRGRSKSMNFDNPVYKKTTATTDDKLELPRNEYQPSRSLPAAMQPLTSGDHTETIDEYGV